MRSEPDRSSEDNAVPESTNQVQGYFVPIPLEHVDDGIDLRHLVSGLARQRLLITVVVAVLTAIATTYSIVTTPVYRAEVLLAPATSEDPGTLSALSGQLGGLASLAGVNLGGNENTDQAIAILKSRSFTEDFIVSQNLLPILYEDQWDEVGEKWNTDSASDIPTMSDAYSKFEDEVRTLNADNRTGLVTLVIEWKDPVLAANWANTLVRRLNEHIRKRDIVESERSISFLNRELEKSSVIELRQGIFRLIEHQIQTMMMANVRDEYAFKVLDPATPADIDKYVRPDRFLIISVAFLMSLFFAILVALLANHFAGRTTK